MLDDDMREAHVFFVDCVYGCVCNHYVNVEGNVVSLSNERAYAPQGCLSEFKMDSRYSLGPEAIISVRSAAVKISFNCLIKGL